MKTWKIYIHRNKTNGKVYIGQTCEDNINNRWNDGEGYKNSTHFYHAIQKYGWDGFKHGIIVDGIATLEEANDLECYWIKEFDSVKNGYNISEGGSNGSTNTKAIKCLNTGEIFSTMKEVNDKIKGMKGDRVKARIVHSNEERHLKGKLYQSIKGEYLTSGVDEEGIFYLWIVYKKGCPIKNEYRILIDKWVRYRMKQEKRPYGLNKHFWFIGGKEYYKEALGYMEEYCNVSEDIMKKLRRYIFRYRAFNKVASSIWKAYDKREIKTSVACRETKKVICLNDWLIYNNEWEASRKYGIYDKSIYDICKHNRKDRVVENLETVKDRDGNILYFVTYDDYLDDEIFYIRHLNNEEE